MPQPFLCPEFSLDGDLRHARPHAIVAWTIETCCCRRDDPLRTGLIATLREMGSAIESEGARAATPPRRWAGLRVRGSALDGVEVPPEAPPLGSYAAMNMDIRNFQGIALHP
jgi:hypothetical protein